MSDQQSIPPNSANQPSSEDTSVRDVHTTESSADGLISQGVDVIEQTPHTITKGTSVIEQVPDTITKGTDVIEQVPDTFTKGENTIEPNASSSF